jgi:hypothetical protein
MGQHKPEKSRALYTVKSEPGEVKTPQGFLESENGPTPSHAIQAQPVDLSQASLEVLTLR